MIIQLDRATNVFKWEIISILSFNETLLKTEQTVGHSYKYQFRIISPMENGKEQVHKLTNEETQSQPGEQDEESCIHNPGQLFVERDLLIILYSVIVFMCVFVGVYLSCPEDIDFAGSKFFTIVSLLSIVIIVICTIAVILLCWGEGIQPAQVVLGQERGIRAVAPRMAFSQHLLMFGLLYYIGFDYLHVGVKVLNEIMIPSSFLDTDKDHLPWHVMFHNLPIVEEGQIIDLLRFFFMLFVFPPLLGFVNLMLLPLFQFIDSSSVKMFPFPVKYNGYFYCSNHDIEDSVV